MAKKLVNITNETGLHARPAADFTKISGSFKCDVYLEKEGRKVNARSILGVLSLAIGKGNDVTIITEGEDEEEALVKLVEFVETIED